MIKDDFIDELAGAYAEMKDKLDYAVTVEQLHKDSVDSNELLKAEGFLLALDSVVDMVRTSDVTIFDDMATYRLENNMLDTEFDVNLFAVKTYEEDLLLRGFSSTYMEVAAYADLLSTLTREEEVTTEQQVAALAAGVLYRLEAISQLGFNPDKAIHKAMDIAKTNILKVKSLCHIPLTEKIWQKEDFSGCRADVIPF